MYSIDYLYQIFGGFENFLYFCAPKRRGARVVEEARLESVYTPKGYPGFESPSLRKTLKINGGKTKTSPVKSRFYGTFLFCRRTSKRQENAPFGQSSVTKSLLKIRRNKIVTILVLSC